MITKSIDLFFRIACITLLLLTQISCDDKMSDQEMSHWREYNGFLDELEFLFKYSQIKNNPNLLENKDSLNEWIESDFIESLLHFERFQTKESAQKRLDEQYPHVFFSNKDFWGSPIRLIVTKDVQYDITDKEANATAFESKEEVYAARLQNEIVITEYRHYEVQLYSFGVNGQDDGGKIDDISVTRAITIYFQEPAKPRNNNLTLPP